jgi:glycosyltransferase involved in cell wall biosynthesis/SAM-dependent methyltransferase/FtsZ-binding cell division protein ZapB
MITSNYQRDRHNILVPKSKSDFKYSDGDEIEEKILSCLKNTRDLSVASDELRAKIWDWASEYHFSPTRANLLIPFNLKQFSNILEIGPGCGAITRLFGERGNHVIALEGSYRRAQITAERCRDLSNVQVVCDSFQDFKIDKQFSCVSMIGVLEYAPRFFESADPVQEALSKANELLDENGVLIIAIENQLGLKYFNGCREDHIGKLFAGINDLYDPNGAVTFGKEELEKKIAAAGFSQTEFVYPFPDYKLPQLLIREEAFKCDQLSVGNIIGQYADRDYLGFAEKNLLENLVWPVLARNQLVQNLANSFLVFAFKGNSSLDDLTSPWLQKSYCGHRKKQYLTENTFLLEESKLTVDRSYLYPLLAENSSHETNNIKHHIGPSDFFHGEPFNQSWLKNLFGDQPFLRYIEYLKPWVDFLKANTINGEKERDAKTGRYLPGNYFDCTPFNLIISTDGKINYFDREWEITESLEFEFIVFRGIYHDLLRYRYWYQRTGLFGDLTTIEWIEKVFAELSISITEEDILTGFLEKELMFQQEINGIFDKYNSHINANDCLTLMRESLINEKGPLLPGMVDSINSPKILSLEIEKRNLEKERDTIRKHYEMMSQIRDNLERESDVLQRQINGYQNDIRWRMGRVVAYFPRKVKSALRRTLLLKKDLIRMLFRIVYHRRLKQRFLEKGKTGVDELLEELESQRIYGKWYGRHYRLNKADRKQIRRHIDSFKQKPLISFIIPTYNTPEKWLRKAIESVMNQLYPFWELCIVDDASTDPNVRKVIQKYARNDNRIKPIYRSSNGHISVASNTGLENATGDFVALLDHDDEITVDALYYVANEITKYPDAHLFYSDEDKLDIDGNLAGPYFKTDWNPDLIYSHNFVCHLGVYRRDILEKIGGFREGFEGAQDWDLCLRFVDQINPEQIRHIPKILYHWRMIPGSTGLDIKYKRYALTAAQQAIEESLQRNGKLADVQYHVHNEYFSAFRVKYVLETEPKVSLIILTRDMLYLLKKCIDSILSKTTYSNYELLIVDNGSQEEETLSYLKEISENGNIRIIRDERPFNFSALNNMAVKETNADVVGLINNDIEILDGDWLREMVSFAVRREVGAAGCRLLYPNDTVQHAGVLVGLGGSAGHAHKHFPAFHPGDNGRAMLIQNFSAVTAACIIMRRDVYQEVGGMDEENLTVAFNDVDFCLKIREAGYLITYTPFAELYHHESASRGYEDTLPKIVRSEKEKAFLANRWGEKLQIDPYYNPNQTLDREDLSPAEPPRFLKPWKE